MAARMRLAIAAVLCIVLCRRWCEEITEQSFCWLTGYVLFSMFAFRFLSHVILILVGNFELFLWFTATFAHGSKCSLLERTSNIGTNMAGSLSKRKITKEVFSSLLSDSLLWCLKIAKHSIHEMATHAQIVRFLLHPLKPNLYIPSSSHLIRPES